MLTVWSQVWPLAVAGALSPSITVIVLALLMRPDRPRARVLAFWLGAAVAMLVWAILISSALWGIVTDTERDLQRFSRAIDLVLAILLLAAQQHIDTAQIPAYQQLALTFIVIGIITASIWLPLLLPLKATDAIHSRLTKPRDWLEAHTKVIEVSAALLGSAYLFYRAFA